MRHRLMIGVALLAIGSATPASADNYPKLNVAPLCHGITQQSALQEGFRDVTFDECIKAEQEDRETMIKEWATFTAAERAHCVAEATVGGESSYTDLVTCLEMARDVRLLKNSKQQDQSPEAVSENKPKHVRHHRRKTE
jgi:hypothetical protein